LVRVRVRVRRGENTTNRELFGPSHTLATHDLPIGVLPKSSRLVDMCVISSHIHTPYGELLLPIRA